MSLLKLKSKTEPLYTNKTIINYDDDTNIQINEIFSNNNSTLSNYRNSMKHHVPLITFFLNHFNFNSKYKSISCPIT